MTVVLPAGVQWHDVTSSNVRRVAWRCTALYPDEPGTLWVEFRNGGVYTYQGVPYKVYDELLAAPSVGGYVARRLRGQYPTERLDRQA